MELSGDSEKQHLIESRLEPLQWTPVDKCSDSEFSEDDEDGLWRPERLCQETDAVSGAESDERRLAKRKLYIACAVSLIFMLGEVIGGYAAHSLAIMTDAAHLLTDFGSIMLSIFSLWISSRPRTNNMTFGWHRAEILGILVSVVSIWAVTAVLVISATQRITGGDYEIDSKIMLITSGCAVGVNVLMVLILHQSGAPHGHSHGFPTGRQQKDKQHSHGKNHGHSHGNASVKAAFVHVVGDLVQSLGVLVAATIIHIWPEYKVADPICTFLFSALVLGTTLSLTKGVFRILMQGTPQDIDFDAVRERLLSVGGVVAVHNLHMWSLNTTNSVVSVHVTAGSLVSGGFGESEITSVSCPKRLSDGKVAKIHFVADPVCSSTLLSFRAGTPVCFSKLGACRPPSTVVNTLTIGEADTQIVLMKATKLLRSEFGFSSITIQVERGASTADSAWTVR